MLDELHVVIADVEQTAESDSEHHDGEQHDQNGDQAVGSEGDFGNLGELFMFTIH